MTAKPTVRRVVAVAGGTGTGKSTLTDHLVRHFGADRITVVHQDHYYCDRSDLPHEERDTLNYDHPDAIEFDFLTEQVKSLAAGESVQRPIYDFVTHTRGAKTESLMPAELILVEGILILHPVALRELFDLKIFLTADATKMMQRRAERDVAERGRPTDPEQLKPFEQHVLPMHTQFVEPCRQWADLILDTTNPQPALLATAVDRIEPLFSAH